MANQVNIPVIQTNTPGLTQVQQNTNKVFNNIYGQLVSAQDSINEMTIIGEVKLAAINLTQFQLIAGTDWILANGQSSVGTAYETLTGNKTVPTVTVSGVTAYIKVN
jgi:hypothetical protein